VESRIRQRHCFGNLNMDEYLLWKARQRRCWEPGGERKGRCGIPVKDHISLKKGGSE
jgi:hypothetical protein